MNPTTKRLSLLLLLATALFSCTKTDTVTPATNATTQTPVNTRDAYVFAWHVHDVSQSNGSYSTRDYVIDIIPMTGSQDSVFILHYSNWNQTVVRAGISKGDLIIPSQGVLVANDIYTVEGSGSINANYKLTLTCDIATARFQPTHSICFGDE